MYVCARARLYFSFVVCQLGRLPASATCTTDLIIYLLIIVIDCTATIPTVPRDSHVSVVHGNSMYCFGGSSGSAMNDLHELQLSSNPSAPAKWRPVKISGPDQPRHRFCHVAVSYNDSMFIFGKSLSWFLNGYCSSQK